MSKTGACLLCDWLVSIRVEYVFCVPGFQVHSLIQEIAHHPKLQAIVATHELGAGFMADGYARTKGTIGVCLSIGGPGASNMLTAAVTARLDNTPLLFLTGNVPVTRADKGAFQDAGKTGTNDIALFRQAVDYSQSVPDRDALNILLHKTSHILQQGGTAHLSIPMDILSAQGDGLQQPAENIFKPSRSDVDDELIELIGSLSNARKILLLLGQRTATPAGIVPIKKFVETYHLPVVTTLAAKGILNEDHELSFGNIGFAGNAQANALLLTYEFDLLLLIGADFNQKDSLQWDSRIRSTNRLIISLDTQLTTYRPPIPVDATYISEDLASQLSVLTSCSENELRPLRLTSDFRRTWLNTLMSRSSAHSKDEPDCEEGMLTEINILRTLRANFAKDTLLYPDSGSSRIFAGKYWKVLKPRTFYSATCTAPTGWAIAAAIGAKLAKPESPVIVLTGDISMLMHGIEIATAFRYGLPVIIIVLDNGGNIGAMCASQNDPNVYSLVQTPKVDWKRFANAFGVKGISVSTLGELKKACAEWTDKPVVIHIHLDIEIDSNVLGYTESAYHCS
ncbi:MAG: thiamine pyrophosphate-binding protein [Candidatus Electrothrix sp. MAN1_4]|nr:thiamine pyrophosphate-binding protein [Candidatus Electrothrix sp. MAN1_4]